MSRPTEEHECRLEFCGAARQVTGSCFLVTLPGCRFLVDCGMHQGRAEDLDRNEAPFRFEPRDLDFVVLTHAHIDHSGYLPLLAKNGFVAVDDASTWTFASTYLDIYNNDLPVFITSDSLLYALHKSCDSILTDLELSVLRAEVDTRLAATNANKATKALSRHISRIAITPKQRQRSTRALAGRSNPLRRHRRLAH